MDGGVLLLAALVALALAIGLFLRFFVRIDLWLSARASGAEFPLSALVEMRFRRVNPQRIVLPYIMAHRAGCAATLMELEAHVLAGGDPARVVNALVMARGRNLPLSFRDCAARDLAGEDPCAFVRQYTSI